MKIKHWQGYGSVSAVRTHSTTNQIVIRVSGLHECGLAVSTFDTYRLAEWLGRVGKFTHQQVESFTTKEEWDSTNKIDTCIYTIKLKEGISSESIY
jgi:hypothetical protein